MNYQRDWAHIEKILLQESDSLGSFLNKIRGQISDVLIEPDQWGRLVNRVSELPVTVAAFPFGFEIPIHDNDSRVDFGLSLIGGSHAATHWQANQDLTNPISDGITKLLDEATREGSELGRIAGNKVLLEYDVDGTSVDTPPEPGIFLYPINLVRRGRDNDAGVSDLNALIDALATIVNWNINPDERRCAEAVFSAMGAHMEIGAVGLFPDRPKAIRIAVSKLKNTSEVTELLDQIGWNGDQSAITSISLMHEENGAFEELSVHVDVTTSGIGPKLGLSFYAEGGPWQKSMDNWQALLSGFEKQNLVHREKLSELINSWSGIREIFGEAGLYVTMRGIHHIKLTFTPNSGVESVKAYIFMLILNAGWPETAVSE